MTISNALSNALSGLAANGRLAEITSGNLANALTPGYGRQAVLLTGSVTGGQGTGVRVAGIARALDPELSAARRLADGDLADRGVRHEALVRLERAIGTVDDAGSLFNQMQRFEAALRALGETPESAPRQQAAATAASDLVRSFNNISTETVRIRESADAEIARQVETVNGALRQIARINRQIQIFEANGRETAALIDERERLVDTVAQNVPIREQLRADGVLELRTLEGITMVDIRAQEIGFAATPVFEPGLSYEGGTGTLGGLTLQGIDITPGGPGPQAIRGGQLAGLFAVRDGIGAEVERQADALAADLVGRLADPAVDPTLGPGDPGLFTDRGLAFNPADIAGIAGRLTLNPAADPTQGGDPAQLRDGLNAATPGPVSDATIPRALSDALARPTDAAAPPAAVPGLSGLLSLAGRISGVAELVATHRVGAAAERSALATAREALATEEAGVLGVDTDAELARLVQIEQAYAANAQVIQTASRMLDELQRIQ